MALISWQPFSRVPASAYGNEFLAPAGGQETASGRTTWAQDPVTPLPDRRRPDFAPREHYVSAEFNQLEQIRLWQRVWQVACREEQVPEPGNYVRYDVVDRSIVVLRGNDGIIRAFHNACRHCSSALATQERGSIAEFSCSSGCWQWNLDGSALTIERYDRWGSGRHIEVEHLDLTQSLVDTWGGFVFINMDPAAEPLMKFLYPVPRYLDCVELSSMKLKRAVTVQLKAKWLTALTCFMESRHLYETHAHLSMLLDDAPDGCGPLCNNERGYPDARGSAMPSICASSVGERSSRAVMRVLEEVPAGAPPEEVYRMAVQFMREAAETDGIDWTGESAEQVTPQSIEWNIFPNIVAALSIDTAVFFRARPDSADVDSCLFDVWILERATPGEMAAIRYEFHPEWRSQQSAVLNLLRQDLHNIEQVQRDMSSNGLMGARPSSIQEMQASNINRSLHEYVYGARFPR